MSYDDSVYWCNDCQEPHPYNFDCKEPVLCIDGIPLDTFNEMRKNEA
jgi:hypothetical protein